MEKDLSLSRLGIILVPNSDLEKALSRDPQLDPARPRKFLFSVFDQEQSCQKTGELALDFGWNSFKSIEGPHLDNEAICKLRKTGRVFIKASPYNYLYEII